MFEKPDEMLTAKSAGSPAFLPPELCVARHGDVSGKAADIWSMGVSLYCLRYGHLPFEHRDIMEMYDAIRNDKFGLPPDENPDFVDLMNRILEKDPKKRIKMPELRVSQRPRLRCAFCAERRDRSMLGSQKRARIACFRPSRTANPWLSPQTTWRFNAP
jgi:serine/threonine protein kinase